MTSNTRLQPSSLIDRLTELPPQPSVALRVLWLLDEPNCTLADLGRLIEADAALSARIMQLANSPFYGAARRISSAAQAVSMLGSVTVRSLAAVSAGGMLDTRAQMPAGFWPHSLAVAAAAAAVARRGHVDASVAFSAGLLHDLGTALLHRHAPAECAAVAEFAALDPGSLLELETRTLGIDHAEVGSIVLTAWQFPDVFAQAVANHHLDPEQAPSPLGACVRAGEAVAELVLPFGAEPVADAARVLADVGIAAASIDAIVEEAREQTESLEALLSW